jgi:hypothetical protein
MVRAEVDGNDRVLIHLVQAEYHLFPEALTSNDLLESLCTSPPLVVLGQPLQATVVVHKVLAWFRKKK